MNYAVAHYRLPSNPCKAAGSMGKSKTEEMHIWTQEQYEQFSGAIQKSSVKLTFDVLFYTGMRSGELLALTLADILPSKRVDINKNYAKVKGKSCFWNRRRPKQSGVSPFRIFYMMIFTNIYRSSTGLERETGFSILQNLPWTRK